MKRPRTTADLRPNERRFVNALQDLEFGRFELIQIRSGEVVLDPWPSSVRDIKFGAASDGRESQQVIPEEFELKREVIELIEYIRSIQSGDIRCLVIRHGVPFTMQVDQRPMGGHLV
jgi:hypothetical protein